MSLVKLCEKGDLEEVKAALQSGVDVNTKGEDGQTGLILAVGKKHNSVVELLLKTPNIDVNLKSDRGYGALHQAVISKNNEALKLLLNVPNIDVNIVTNTGRSAVYWAVEDNNNEGLKLLLSHPSLTSLTLNQRDKYYGATPVMLAVEWDRWEPLALLAEDLRVDLDTTDKEGKSLEEAARWLFMLNSQGHKILIKHLRDSPEALRVVEEAKQRREERRRQGT